MGRIFPFSVFFEDFGNPSHGKDGKETRLNAILLNQCTLNNLKLFT
jgi:hypothetical protein